MKTRIAAVTLASLMLTFSGCGSVSRQNTMDRPAAQVETISTTETTLQTTLPETETATETETSATAMTVSVTTTENPQTAAVTQMRPQTTAASTAAVTSASTTAATVATTAKPDTSAKDTAFMEALGTWYCCDFSPIQTLILNGDSTYTVSDGSNTISSGKFEVQQDLAGSFCIQFHDTGRGDIWRVLSIGSRAGEPELTEGNLSDIAFRRTRTASDPANTYTPIMNIAGVWNENESIDPRTLTISSDSRFELAYQDGRTMCGTIDAKTAGDETKYYFYNADGSLWCEFTKALVMPDNKAYLRTTAYNDMSFWRDMTADDINALGNAAAGGR